MAYTRVNWQNSPSHATPLSAENLNVMDEGIYDLDAAVTEATGDIADLETTVSGHTTSITGLQTTVGEHTTDISNIEDDVSGLQTTVSGHTTSIGTLANLTTTEKSNLVGAINEVNEDVSDVKEDLAEVTDSLDTITSSNIYNISDSTENLIIYPNGAEEVNTNYTASGFIPVTEGQTIKSYYVVNGTVYPANMYKIACYDATKTIVVSAGQGSVVNTFDVPTGIKYIRVTLNTSLGNTFMLVSDGTVPTSFIAYEKRYVASAEFVADSLTSLEVVKGTVTKEKTDFWLRERSANLFDRMNVITGEYFNPDGGIRTTTNVFRSYVELNGAGVYTFYVMGNFFGLANAVKIPMFDKERVYIRTLTATTTDTAPAVKNLVTLVVSDTDISDGITYLGYTEHPQELDNLMVVKSNEYPSEYIPYKNIWTIPDLVGFDSNPLAGKIAVFDGDSICAGLNSAMDSYGNGYASRIAVNNGMTAYNVGVSGACITADTYFDGDTSKPRHWISRYIDTIYANYPDADYIIGEGGTNDADNFYNTPEKLGTFDEADFTGPYDDTTFYGAMDSWCKKALTYFPKAKIGFIVAHKMGTGFVTYVKNRYDYFTHVSKVCKKWGIPVINLWDEGQLRPDVTSMYDPNYNTIETATEHGLPYYDGQHLTAYGYDILSHKIAEWMKSL